MAVEAKRGCGYRKVGGLYLVSGGFGVPCDRLPIELTVCPCCHGGFKQSRGWTWIDVALLVGGDHTINTPSKSYPCDCQSLGRCCPLCENVKGLGKAGLLWIGEKFYPTPADFDREGAAMGISRRISAIPRNFKVGETWILLAHPKTIARNCSTCGGSGYEDCQHRGAAPADHLLAPLCEKCKGSGREHAAGIFKLWRPSAIEKICKESERGSAMVAELEAKGITPIFVPDDDKDHQGSVHDKVEEVEEETSAV